MELPSNLRQEGVIDYDSPWREWRLEILFGYWISDIPCGFFWFVGVILIMFICEFTCCFVRYLLCVGMCGV